jgi:hypothetical protein
MRLESGDDVYFRRDDDDPSVLMVIPSEVVERRYQAGDAAEASAREHAQPLGAIDESVRARTTSARDEF